MKILNKHLSVSEKFFEELRSWTKEQKIEWLMSKKIYFGMTEQQKKKEIQLMYAKIKPVKTRERTTDNSTENTTSNGKNSSRKRRSKRSKKE